MTEKTKWGLAGLAAGALITGAVIYTAVIRDNEDRPPMVVKGGSLIFQSGVNSANPGKQWQKNPNAQNEWQMNHSAGKPTNAFSVMMTGSGTCGPGFVTELTLEYTRSSDQSVRTFQLVRKAQFGTSGKMVPTVVGDGLAPTNAGDTPYLTYAEAGDLTRVSATNIDCRSPADFMVYAVK